MKQNDTESGVAAAALGVLLLFACLALADLIVSATA